MLTRMLNARPTVLPVQAFGVAELVADDREVAQRGVQDLLLQMRVAVQDEARGSW